MSNTLIKYDLTESLTNRLKRSRLILRETNEYLNLVFDHGGYVAGGFAVLLARRFLGIIDDATFDACVMQHLASNHEVTWEMAERSKFADAGKSDIDVFFPTKKHLHDFFNAVTDKNLVDRKSGSWQVTSLSGKAKNVMIRGREKIQVITKYPAVMDEQISEFDIYNAAVAFNDKQLIVLEHFEQLERVNMLHVMKWNLTTLLRICKYLRTKNYKAISPKSCAEIYELILQNSNEFNRADLDPFRNFLNPYKTTLDASTLQKQIYKIMTSMTSEQLLMLSSIFPRDHEYDLDARSILHKRIKS